MAERYRADVLVCTCASCSKRGASEFKEALAEELDRRGLSGEVQVVETGSRGFCSEGPVVIVQPEGILYRKVDVADVPDVVEETLVKGRVVE